MESIRNFQELTEKLTGLEISSRIAVARAEDPNTLGAIKRATEAGFVRAILIGNQKRISDIAGQIGLNAASYQILEAETDASATELAVELVKTGEADILMKGLVNTDLFLKAVLSKDNGLMIPGAVMSYVCALQIPAYHKLLFVTDTAVLPAPDLRQKTAMLQYSLEMTKRFGIHRPKIALIGASEKAGNHSQTAIDCSILCKMAERGQLGDCIVDGPLDVFLACDPESLLIKNVQTPIGGDADVLLFPTLEACNAFYKGLVRFAGAELAGLIRGTQKPVVVMSRSESENSKFYCLALACLMASEN
jgi:phosphate butyryltransferase